jgi:zinc protease
VTDKTAEALKAMLADIDDFARTGITDEEAEKTRLQTRADVVEQYETIEHTCAALAHDASLGLPPDWEAKTAALADQADRQALNGVASTFFSAAAATVVIVGSRATLEGPLTQAGFGPIDFVDEEGHPAAPATAAAPPAKATK